MFKPKVPACTFKVQSALAEADDFLSRSMLIERTQLTRNQVDASLHHLRKRRAIDCIIQPDGVAWWYITPETDDRTRTLTERTPEVKARRTRHKKETVK